MTNEWISLQHLGYSMYEANHTGIVRRISNKRVLKRKPHKCQYIKLCIKHDEGSYKNVKVDGLICKTFIGPPPSTTAEIIHINGDTLDSNKSNLKWGTYAEKVQVDTKDFRSVDYIGEIMLPSEEWKDAGPYGYIDYLASSLGRIYSMKSGKVVSGNTRVDGYMQTTIPIKQVNTPTLMHVLICHAFYGYPPDETYTVDHIDRNKINNVPSNLRWASKSEQTINRYPLGKRKYMITEVINGKIHNFYEYQSILEILDVDHIIIPDEGLFYNGSLLIYENFINLDIIGEIWAPINVRGKIIMVSNMGRVRKMSRKTFGCTLGSGYKSVNIEGSPFLVHRLVIIAFRGNYDPSLVVNHIDRNKLNNRLDNLEVITVSENVIHAYNTGHKGLKCVQQLSLDGTLIDTYTSIRKASEATDVGHSSIGKTANGKQKTAGGFLWRFI